MTIIEPNKNSFKSKIVAYLLMGLVLFEAGLSIFAYNQSVQLNYSLKENHKKTEIVRAENADLKNQLYLALDIENADVLAGKLGLIKERKPEYLAQR
ncbi:MAG: hypothetical protein Q7S83_01865 [bacterium]|nr:hypothetical protein [bacterium]